ncbi:MAG: hypothetical protein ACFB0C_20070 [Leptolyngbyaceae cyanobacterium]
MVSPAATKAAEPAQRVQVADRVMAPAAKFAAGAYFWRRVMGWVRCYSTLGSVFFYTGSSIP